MGMTEIILFIGATIILRSVIELFFFDAVLKGIYELQQTGTDAHRNDERHSHSTSALQD